jgi:predicted component of type VI protein secretion system
MVQLQILSGKKAGAQFTASRLPLQIGRAAGADLSLEEPGVWPRHCHIARQGRDLVCQAEANALLSVNGVQVDQAVLRNGDVISIGALKIQFALSPVRQSSLRWRESLTWAALALLCLGQVVLIYRLMR